MQLREMIKGVGAQSMVAGTVTVIIWNVRTDGSKLDQGRSTLAQSSFDTVEVKSYSMWCIWIFMLCTELELLLLSDGKVILLVVLYAPICANLEFCLKLEWSRQAVQRCVRTCVSVGFGGLLCFCASSVKWGLGLDLRNVGCIPIHEMCAQSSED